MVLNVSTRRAIVAASLLLFTVVLPGPARAADEAVPRRVKVLWLGDNGHHVPLERCRQAFSALGQRGIDLTYTDDVADLNPQTLDRYDVPAALRQHRRRSRRSRRRRCSTTSSPATASSPIHCGSLLLPQLAEDHRPDRRAVQEPQHRRLQGNDRRAAIIPIEKGLKPIESWDETYVHEMHNEKDRTVLGYRVEGDQKEPYTWVRTQGKGRVFYTAWGHDERTWGNEDFQDLLERGIRWAAGDWALQPQPPAQAVRRTSTAQRSRTTCRARSGAPRAAPITQMQVPLPPGRVDEAHGPAAGLRGEAVRRRPGHQQADLHGLRRARPAVDRRDRRLPQQHAARRRGPRPDRRSAKTPTATAWPTSSPSSPTSSRIPTSMCFANGGVIVAQAPDMLFLKDTKGDDQADVRQGAVHRLGHARHPRRPEQPPLGLRQLDLRHRRLLAASRATSAGRTSPSAQGVFRFKPDGSKLEFLGSTTNNTWGLGLSEDDQVFGSTANGNPASTCTSPTATTSR